MTRARRDAEFTEFAQARLMALRRIGYLLCRDWDRADGLAQGAITKLYWRWNRHRRAGTASPCTRRSGATR